jgi:hypothetical protein
VLQCEDDRNKKSALCCEEAVQDRDSLWKAKEKTSEILRRRSVQRNPNGRLPRGAGPLKLWASKPSL